jgi:phage tail-like protein
MALSSINRFSNNATDPLRSFRYQAEFTAVGTTGSAVFDSRIVTWKTGFSSITGLSMSTQNITYREGGYNTTVHQIPGMTVFQPIVFQRGTVSGNDEAITWMRGLFAAASGDGISTVNKDFRLNIDLYIMDHPDANATTTNVSKMSFRIHNAWITSLSYSDLNGGENSLLFESMTVVHEGLTVAFTDKTPDRKATSNSATSGKGSGAVTPKVSTGGGITPTYVGGTRIS